MKRQLIDDEGYQKDGSNPVDELMSLFKKPVSNLFSDGTLKWQNSWTGPGQPLRTYLVKWRPVEGRDGAGRYDSTDFLIEHDPDPSNPEPWTAMERMGPKFEELGTFAVSAAAKTCIANKYQQNRRS